MEKKIVYWGIGNICRMCLESHPNIKPYFFIDSKSEDRNYLGISVKRPDEIVNWTDFFVVIVNISYDVIKEEMKKRGLQELEDYDDFRHFFRCKAYTVKQSIEHIQKDLNAYGSLRGRIWLVAPTFIARKAGILNNFFLKYANMRKPELFLQFSRLEVISESLASEQQGYPVINSPRVCDYYGVRVSEFVDYIDGDIELSEEEELWIRELEKRKTADEREIAYSISKNIFYYYKKLIELLKPKQIIIWGGWERQSYILGHLSDVNSIPHGFMEYGWIPGTLQFDRRGIAGNSEYINGNYSLDKSILDRTNMRRIFEYVVRTEYDTGNSLSITDEQDALKNMKKGRKTVLFVGMGDKGMGINPDSLYWKKYVSSVVRSSESAFFILRDICNKLGWNFIFKPHPGELQDLKMEYIDDCILVRETKIDDLIKLADVVVSITSAVDYKVLMYDKPLVQLGINSLVSANCTYVVKSKSDIKEKLAEAIENGFSDAQKACFCDHMALQLCNTLWDDLSPRELRYGKSIKNDFFEREKKIENSCQWRWSGDGATQIG